MLAYYHRELHQSEVAVAHVNDLVRKDPAHLAGGHSAHQPLRQCNRGCLTTSNREGDRKPLTDPVKMRGAIETGAATQRINNLVEYGCFPMRHRACADRAENEPRRYPPNQYKHHSAAHEAPENSVPFGDDPATIGKKRRHRDQKQGRVMPGVTAPTLAVYCYHAASPTVETADKNVRANRSCMKISRFANLTNILLTYGNRP